MHKSIAIGLLKKRVEAHVCSGTLSTGQFKPNTNGASKGNPGAFGYGGLIQADDGRWTIGFSYHIGNCSAYKAKLWGILLGLKVAWNYGIRKLILESDSMAIVTILNTSTH